MKATANDGVDLWWDTEGEGPTVVLVPGRGDSTDVYPQRFSDRLVAGGCRVVRYDPRDAGLSGDGGDAYALTDMAEDVATVVAAAGSDGPHLVGLSMGGVLLVDLVVRHPDLARSLVFLAAMSPDPDAGIGDDFFAAFGADPVEATLRAIGEDSDEVRSWVEAEQHRAGRRAPPRPDAVAKHQEAAYRLAWPALDALAEVRVPTIVVHGDGDRVLPVQHARSLASGITGAELVVVPGMGHLPRPGDWDDIASRMLSQVRATEATLAG